MISMINASDSAFDKQHRLTTTRITSQVCRRWREVILGSATMWGRLILLDKAQKLAWIEEVFTRAESSSLLWVEFNAHQPDSESSTGNYQHLLGCLERILQKWDRIEILNVIAGYSFATEHSLYNLLWDHMAMPAPALRSCSVTSPFHVDRASSTLPRNIFLDHIPHLVSLSCTGFRIDSNTRWLSNLNALRFSPRSIEDILNVLSWAPHLQALGIDGDRNCFRYVNDIDCSKLASMSPEILPRLTHIKADMSLDAINALWSMSSISPDETWIDINIYPEYTGNGRKQLPSTLANIFQHLLIRASCLWQTIQCSLIIDSPLRNMRIQCTFTTLKKTVRLLFNSGGLDVPHITLFFLDCLSPYMKTATNLLLRLTPSAKEFPWRQVLCDSIVPLNMVTDIAVDDISMKWYNEIEESGVTLFPNLRIVKCYGFIHPRQWLARSLQSFFCRRVQRGEGLPPVKIFVPDTLADNFKHKIWYKLPPFWYGTQVDVEGKYHPKQWSIM